MLEPLRKLAEVHYGKSPAAITVQDSEIPIFGTGGAYGHARCALFNGPAVIVPRKGSLGNPQFVQTPFWAADTTYAVMPRPRIDAKWLFYHLDSFDLTKLNEATGVPSINREWLYRTTFETPSFEEQSEISSVLSSVDELIEKTEVLIAKHRQIKAGMMQELFTRGVMPNGRLRPPRVQSPEVYKQTSIGWIPKEWGVSDVRAATSLCIDCPHTTPVLSDEGYSMARTSEIRDGRLLIGKSPKVSREEFRTRTSRGIPMPGDIVFTREAPVGEAFVIPANVKICLGQRVMLIRPIPEKCNSQFLTFQIYSERVKREFARIVGGTTNPHLNVDDVRRFVLALPEIEEQSMIAARLRAIDERIDSERSAVLKLLHLKQGLMHDLLTGTVRVKLND